MTEGRRDARRLFSVFALRSEEKSFSNALAAGSSALNARRWIAMFVMSENYVSITDQCIAQPLGAMRADAPARAVWRRSDEAAA